MQQLDKAAAGLPVPEENDLVLRAMRLAEKAHRGGTRKAPEGEDRPAYFLHLAEVATRLQQACQPDEVVAAGYLHDTIEDCGFTRDALAEAIGSEEVANLVAWVSVPGEDHKTWRDRNAAYLKRIQRAPKGALALSCTDKTANMNDMLRLVRKGHALDDFLSAGAADQIKKFRTLRMVFFGRVPLQLMSDFDGALDELVSLAGAKEKPGPGVALLRLRNERVSATVDASITDDGSLQVDAYDVGTAVDDAFGDSDLERWLKIAPPYKDALLLALLADRFGGHNLAFWEIGDFLEVNGIPVESGSWT